MHDWMAAHRGQAARAVMNMNPRYIFFRVLADDSGGTLGAARAPLPAGRALAVDPAQHAYGDLAVDRCGRPDFAGARPAYRRLVVALDTGSAIRGAVRGDLYLGEGPAAGEEAGQVRHRLRLWRLRPRPPVAVAATP